MGAQEGWTEARIVRLREMWAAGDPTAAIGAALGVTKSAAVAKAHRLRLTPRPSPIKPAGGGQNPERQGRPDGPAARQAPLATTMAAMSPPPRIVLQDGVIVRADERPGPETVFQPPRSVPCCWPVGPLPGRPRYRFCEAASVPGKGYCAVHEAEARPRAARQAAPEATQARPVPLAGSGRFSPSFFGGR